MTNLEKYGLLLMLLGVVSFRDGGWVGGLGTLLLIGGFMMFLWDTKDAPNKVLQSDGATPWRWADDPCPSCRHVHRAYGAAIKHCPVCGFACKYYGEASLVSPEPPRR